MEIFTALSDSCATAVPPSNIGSINLRTIPGYDPSYYIGDNVGKGSPSRNVTFEGNAVNVGYPSYLITGAINPNYWGDKGMTFVDGVLCLFTRGLEEADLEGKSSAEWRTA